ncbi:substrate-binding domain-containing protein [Ruminococcus sp. Marseille-P6503]|uniref:substrate-binding domain-containing protein n=1 Tax=Ruminococcus sp. Marseille-P6503 TaxID=2364796 RepID=UPI001FA9F028|nr:substrate-binding domain-containing protein [Ruminococcus sp. Marseille-P6503]
MMRKTRFLSVIAAAVLSASMLASCGGSDNTIAVISREDGSGTRGAFIELTGVEEKDADGNKTDKTTVEAAICKSTDVVLTQVAGDKNSIGYVSLGSLNDTVKAVKVGGVEATSENVENGSYTIVRPFNIVLSEKGISEAAQDFENYILSKEGQEIIGKDYIAVNKSAEAFSSNGAEGKVVVEGSSSVTPVMEKLAEAYQKVNAKVTVEVQQSDSSTGVKSAQNGTCDIGMASRELSSDETGVSGVVIAQDAIAVIVNKDNEVDDLSVEQIRAIYTGETTSWDDVK